MTLAPDDDVAEVHDINVTRFIGMAQDSIWLTLPVRFLPPW